MSDTPAEEYEAAVTEGEETEGREITDQELWWVRYRVQQLTHRSASRHFELTDHELKELNAYWSEVNKWSDEYQGYRQGIRNMVRQWRPEWQAARRKRMGLPEPDMKEYAADVLRNWTAPEVAPADPNDRAKPKMIRERDKSEVTRRVIPTKGPR